MNKFYKIKVKLNDGSTDVYINKDRITRFYTYEDAEKSEYKLSIHVDCGYDHDGSYGESEVTYSSLFDNQQDYIKELNKLIL